MLSHDSLTDALHGMFEMAPTAFCISTASASNSRYVKVNQAYLDLVGKTWDELQSEPLSANTGVVSPARARRIHLLDTVGFYRLEEVELRHASGRAIPTLISCQRRIVAGEVADIEIIIDNSERKEFENRILKAAFTDTMTDLPNRAAFDQELRQRIAAKTEEQSLGLAFLDLNGFKAVNDQHGHTVGDGLLQVIAKRLRWRSRACDFVARLGGDEFAVLFDFPARREAEALSRFGRLARGVCLEVRIGRLKVDIGVAIGIATAAGRTTPDRLLDAADRLMYDAKATGERIAVRAVLGSKMFGLPLPDFQPE